MKKIIVILLVFFCVSYAHATHNEILYGTYSYESSDFSLKFSLDNSGINDFSINGEKLAISTYDYLGWYGSTQLLEIQIVTGRVIQTIKLLILVSGDQVKLTSGQYVKALIKIKDDDEFYILKHKTFEMVHKPIN